jgi:hypothetical protein
MYPPFEPYHRSLTYLRLNLLCIRNINERKMLFETASFLLEDFPRRLNATLRKSNTTMITFLGDRKNLPQWFIKGLESKE